MRKHRRKLLASSSITAWSIDPSAIDNNNAFDHIDAALTVVRPLYIYHCEIYSIEMCASHVMSSALHKALYILKSKSSIKLSMGLAKTTQHQISSI